MYMFMHVAHSRPVFKIPPAQKSLTDRVCTRDITRKDDNTIIILAGHPSPRFTCVGAKFGPDIMTLQPGTI